MGAENPLTIHKIIIYAALTPEGTFLYPGTKYGG